jgi:hypothetical protein
LPINLKLGTCFVQPDVFDSNDIRDRDCAFALVQDASHRYITPVAGIACDVCSNTVAIAIPANVSIATTSERAIHRVTFFSFDRAEIGPH